MKTEITSLLINAASKNTGDLFSFVAAQHNIAAVKASTTTHKRSEQIDPQRAHNMSVGFSTRLSLSYSYWDK